MDLFIHRLKKIVDFRLGDPAMSAFGRLESLTILVLKTMESYNSRFENNGILQFSY